MNPISPFHNPVFLHPSRTHEGKVALRHPRMIRKVLPSSKNLTCNEFLATNNSLLQQMPADVFNCRFPTKNQPPSTYIMQDPKILRETINCFLVLLSSSHGFGFEQERNDTRLHCKMGSNDRSRANCRTPLNWPQPSFAPIQI